MTIDLDAQWRQVVIEQAKKKDAELAAVKAERDRMREALKRACNCHAELRQLPHMVNCPAALATTHGTERPRSRVLTGMDLAHAEAVAENGHRENHAGYGCTFCGSFWNPTGWGSEWHKPGCAKVEPQATTGKECRCDCHFDYTDCVRPCCKKPEGRGEG